MYLSKGVRTVLVSLVVLSLLYILYSAIGGVDPQFNVQAVRYKSQTQKTNATLNRRLATEILHHTIRSAFSLRVNDHTRCQKWAIVAPVDWKWASEAVRRQVRMHDWCLVIVLEQEPSENYDTRWFAEEGGNKIVVILTPRNVKLVSSLVDSEFVQANTWDYIGRKNIGYYYAITHGAKTIWDFDDDNMLKFWIPGAAPPGAPSIEASLPVTERVNVLELDGHTKSMCSTWNPYPAMGAPSQPSWPRGLPLDDATNEQCSRSELKPSTITNGSIAVLQSLSDRQPDADALYEAIMPFPFYFKKREMKTVLVPPYTLTPYNMRATLHFEVGFWALFLPTSVDRELSDIWRSYIGQRLFWETGLRVGFIGRPLVVQDRNIHTSLDKAAIKKHSSKVRRLINFLRSWSRKENILIRHIKELWRALEQNGFISQKDVTMMHLWLQSLTKLKYKLPLMLSRNSVPEYTAHQKTGELSLTLAKIFPRKLKTERYTVRKNTPEYDDTICQLDSTTGSLTFWNSDIHFGTVLDQPSFLGELGHKVIVDFDHIHQNPNPHVWKMKGVLRYHRVSNVLRTNFCGVKDQNNAITESMIMENFNFYKKDSIISSVNAFLCLYQPGMCEMWMPFNKTLVFLPAHRYNMGRCTIEQTKRLNEHLYMLSNMTHPKHVISASSKYDLEYLRHYTGLEILPLYSYCLYVTNYTYAPSRNEILIFVRETKRFNNWDKRFLKDIKRVKIVNVNKRYKPYRFSDLVQHRAIVFLSYAVMTYKLTELYTLGIPLFIPSMKYYQTIKPFGPDRTVLSFIWCKDRGSLNDSQMLPYSSSIHSYSPNAMDEESEFYWLQFADFVQWPHITYFDDFKDLEQKLLTADFDKIHKLMVEENKRKRRELENNWCKVFNKIEKRRNVPQDYSKAIRDLYGVSQLQVDIMPDMPLS